MDININSSYRYLYKNHRNQGIAALINIQIFRLILQRYCTGTYIYMNVFMQELEFQPYGLITLKPHNYWNILPVNESKLGLFLDQKFQIRSKCRNIRRIQNKSKGSEFALISRTYKPNKAIRESFAYCDHQYDKILMKHVWYQIW